MGAAHPPPPRSPTVLTPPHTHTPPPFPLPPPQVNAFIVRNKLVTGLKTEKIENKIALRIVQNADMYFDRVFVPDSARLPGVNSFKDTNKVLAISRCGWARVGRVVAGLCCAANFGSADRGHAGKRPPPCLPPQVKTKQLKRLPAF